MTELLCLTLHYRKVARILIKKQRRELNDCWSEIQC